jgi:predicted SAM-dependent methyltransferase
MDKLIQINVGCGLTPTKGWLNFDNSPSVWLSKMPYFLSYLFYKVGLLGTPKYHFIETARFNHIKYANAAKRLPLPSASVDVLYSSHMIEHLDRAEATLFLKEARRVLRSGGIIRLVVPDLRKQVMQYIKSKDTDVFISATMLTQPRPKLLRSFLRILFVGGTHHHQWMYDSDSIVRLLLSHGFLVVGIVNPGETRIKDPGALDLKERLSESVYVEGVNP